MTHESGKIAIGDAHIAVTTEADVSKLDWSKAGIDVVVTESGENARRLLDQGAKKVVVIGGAAGDDMHTLMLGINDASYDPENHHLVATGHSTENALAPLIAVLNETFAAVRATYTVINPVSDADAIADRLDGDGRTARAAWRNIIPARGIALCRDCQPHTVNGWQARRDQPLRSCCAGGMADVVDGNRAPPEPRRGRRLYHGCSGV